MSVVGKFRQALAEVVAHAKDLHALFGDRLSPADMEAFCHERVCPHKVRACPHGI